MNGRLLSERIEGGCRARWSLEGLYPCLSRDTSAKILEIVANATHDKQIAIYESLKFANDGLFCEWAYVNDLDKDTLEIYGGHETKHHGHCFNDIGAEDETIPAFVISFDFSRLYIMTGLEEFLKAIPKISNSEEQTVVEDGDAYVAEVNHVTAKGNISKRSRNKCA